MPGQFQGLVNIAIDKQDRVFTTEIYPGRLQQFKYITDAEADKEREKRAAERAKVSLERKGAESPKSSTPAKPN